MSLRASVHNWQTPLFFIAAFAMSWYPWILGLLGVTKASGINPLGVLIAAFIVTGMSDGWAGVKALLARIGRRRMGWRWFAAAIGIPIAILAAAGVLNLALGATKPTEAQWALWPEIVDRFLFAFLFVGLGEEPGWRGFALPALYQRCSPLAASLLLGTLWAAWHLPLMGTEFTWNVAPCFVISVFAGSVVLAWLFNGSCQSVLSCMLMHATVNSVGAGYVFRLFSDADLLRLWWIYALMWALVAAFIAWRAGPSLAQRIDLRHQHGSARGAWIATA